MLQHCRFLRCLRFFVLKVWKTVIWIMWNKFYLSLSSLLMCTVNFWEGEHGQSFLNVDDQETLSLRPGSRDWWATSLGEPAYRKGVSEAACTAQIAGLWPGAQKKLLWSSEDPHPAPWEPGLKCERKKPFLVIKHLLGHAYLPPLGALQCDPSKSFLLIITNIRCGGETDMQRHMPLLGKL